MSESKHMKICIERIQKGSGFAEVTDVETKGRFIYEELMPKRASEFVRCWNSHDKLLEALQKLADIFPEHSMRELDAADFKDRAQRIWTASQIAKNLLADAKKRD